MKETLEKLNNSAPFTAENGLVYGVDGLLCETFNAEDAKILAELLNKASLPHKETLDSSKKEEKA